MSRLSRRALFALPLVAPLAVAAAAGAGPSAAKLRVGAADSSAVKAAGQLTGKAKRRRVLLRTPAELAEIRARELEYFARWPSDRDLAATLGIKHEESPEPHVWTDDEVALTLGIDVQRDGFVIGTRMVRT